MVKVEVDHLNGIEWENMIEYIYRHLIPDPQYLETVCESHHLSRTIVRKHWKNLPKI